MLNAIGASNASRKFCASRKHCGETRVKRLEERADLGPVGPGTTAATARTEVDHV